MVKKTKNQPKDFLKEIFGKEKELVVNDTNREKIEKELNKRGISYSLGDYPIVKNGSVAGFEKKILLSRPLTEDM